MNIRAVAIQIPAGASDTTAPFEAKIQLEIDGREEWFTFSVTPLGMPGSDVQLLEAESDFVSRFRDHRGIARHIRRLVGQAVRQGAVHLPQLIAA
jgi:hypothetical protein